MMDGQIDGNNYCQSDNTFVFKDDRGNTIDLLNNVLIFNNNIAQEQGPNCQPNYSAETTTFHVDPDFIANNELVSNPDSYGADTQPKKAKPKRIRKKDGESGRVRRKIADPAQWKRNIRKRLYQLGEEHYTSSGTFRPKKTFVVPTCPGCRMQCTTKFDEYWLQGLYEAFRVLDTHNKRQYLARLVDVADVKRVRTKAQKSRRTCTRSYHLPSSRYERIAVCRRFFCSLFQVSSAKIATVCKKRGFYGIMEGDRRGQPPENNAKNKTTKKSKIVGKKRGKYKKKAKDNLTADESQPVRKKRPYKKRAPLFNLDEIINDKFPFLRRTRSKSYKTDTEDALNKTAAEDTLSNISDDESQIVDETIATCCMVEVNDSETEDILNNTPVNESQIDGGKKDKSGVTEIDYSGRDHNLDNVTMDESPATDEKNVQDQAEPVSRGRAKKQNVRKRLHKQRKEHTNESGNLKPKKILCIPICGRCHPKCRDKLGVNQLEEIFEAFQRLDKHNKRNYLSLLIEEENIKRVRTKAEISRRKCTRHFYVLTPGYRKTPVCRFFFCKFFQISPAVIEAICKKRDQYGILEKDKRGEHPPGNALSDFDTNMIREHINSFPREANKSLKSKKEYLPSDLNLDTMYKKYVEQCAKCFLKPASLSMYSEIFHKDFNLSFQKEKGGSKKLKMPDTETAIIDHDYDESVEENEENDLEDSSDEDFVVEEEIEMEDDDND